MPYRANPAQRHLFPKARCRVSNWAEYDRALPERGRLTGVTPEAIAAWQPPLTGKRGRAYRYSDLAIETGHLLRLAFHRPWRQTEGLLRSIATLLGVSLPIPDHTTFSRRRISPPFPMARRQKTEPIHIVIDSTGLKVYGAGEVWRGTMYIKCYCSKSWKRMVVKS